MTIMRSQERMRVAAHHEAGHAVLAFKLNIAFRKKGLSISPDEDSRGQFWHSGAIGGDPSVEITDRMVTKAERQVMCMLAGIESQRRFRLSSVRNYHASGDYQGAIDLLMRFAGSGEEVELWIRLLRFRTRAIVNSSLWWPVIEGLATTLVSRHRLTGPEAIAEIRRLLTPPGLSATIGRVVA